MNQKKKRTREKEIKRERERGHERGGVKGRDYRERNEMREIR
jgi:hypothetical protein